MSILDKPHNDWPWPFSLIPRGATAVKSDVVPHKVAHSANLTSNPDVPNKGAWAISVSKYGFNLAATTAGGWHFRLGTFRYDYVDKYYTFPTLTVKKLK